MKYKYGFVIREANDYLRNVDFSYFNFFKKEYFREFGLRSDKGIVYIEEDVNTVNTEKFAKLLESNGIGVEIVSCVKWKKFPKQPYVFK